MSPYNINALKADITAAHTQLKYALYQENSKYPIAYHLERASEYLDSAMETATNLTEIETTPNSANIRAQQGACYAKYSSPATSQLFGIAREHILEAFDLIDLASDLTDSLAAGYTHYDSPLPLLKKAMGYLELGIKKMGKNS